MIDFVFLSRYVSIRTYVARNKKRVENGQLIESKKKTNKKKKCKFGGKKRNKTKNFKK